MRVLFITLLISAPIACSSGSDGEGPPGKELYTLGPKSDSAGEEPGLPARPGPTAPGGASLLQGKMSVLGLALPSGMLPARGPDKVYRFTGNFSVPHLASFIQEKVTAEKREREGDGYLLRGARVIKAVGKTPSGERLAIRIFKPAGGGSTIDIWREMDHAGKLPTRTVRSAAPTGDDGAVRMSRRESNRRKHERRQAWNALDKLSRGENLNDEDLKYFH